MSKKPSRTMKAILDKYAGDSTSLEHAVCILYLMEVTKGKPLAEEAAAELAALRAELDAAQNKIAEYEALIWEATNNPDFGLSEYGQKRFDAALEQSR